MRDDYLEYDPMNMAYCFHVRREKMAEVIIGAKRVYQRTKNPLMFDEYIAKEMTKIFLCTINSEIRHEIMRGDG